MGKGSNPRNCFSRQFKQNFDRIDWKMRRTSKETRKRKEQKRERLQTDILPE